ncbi:MAG: SH3 domain-containing protein [Anaerolineales bacterium]|jgi:hypothetical protein
MKRFWFKAAYWIVILAALLAGFFGTTDLTDVLAQEATQGSSDVFITVTYTEQINVRNGPSTVLYDIIGNMQPGETAPALGVSPGRDWVQIAYPVGPGGVAWVHTSLISISPGNLQIIEPPPTVTPQTTPTTDPTLAAAYVFEPTVTRMPTFTPPPPLEVPEFTSLPPGKVKDGVPMGAFVIGAGVLGLLGYLVSLLRRR